jgi:hypothetical protein
MDDFCSTCLNKIECCTCFAKDAIIFFLIVHAVLNAIIIKKTAHVVQYPKETLESQKETVQTANKMMKTANVYVIIASK